MTEPYNTSSGMIFLQDINFILRLDFFSDIDDVSALISS